MKKKSSHQDIPDIPKFKSKYSPDPDSWPFSEHEDAGAKRAGKIRSDASGKSSRNYLFKTFGLPEEKNYEAFFWNHAPEGNSYALVREQFRHNLEVRWKGEVRDKEISYMTYTATRETPSRIVLKFWEKSFFAYCTIMKPSITDPTLPKIPIKILDPKMKSEKLDSLLHYPKLLSKDPSIVDEKGRKRGKASKLLRDYVGSDPKNQLAFKNYERLMEFLPYLVNATASINEKKKYILASHFLLGFLGVGLMPEQIKDRLRR